MTYRALMVMKMDPSDADQVAEIFAEHDRSDLPHIVGISRRTLFRINDLYLHSIEAPENVYDKLYEARSHPLFQSVNARLAPILHRYDPETWRELKDSMATPFYSWSTGDQR